MGTISDKLQAVLDSKAAIKAAIIAKGGSAGDVLSEYASAIENLPSGGDDSLLLYGILGVNEFDLTVPNDVNIIPDYCLSSNKKIQHVDGQNVTTIKIHAFSNSSIVTCNFPIVNTIEDRAFQYSNDFQGDSDANLILPEGLTSLGTVVFEGCSRIEHVLLPSTLLSIPLRTFSSDFRIATIDVNGDITSIGEQAFNNCSGLTTLSLYGVTNVPTLGIYAFRGCSALAHIRVPSGLVDAFKAASGWSDFASIIEAI